MAKITSRAFAATDLLVSLAVAMGVFAIVVPSQVKPDDETPEGASKVGAAVLLYVADNGDTFPVGCGPDGWHPKSGGWVQSIKPYVRREKFFLAARDPQSKKTWPKWLLWMPEAIHISFPANGYLRQDEKKKWGLAGVMGLNQAEGAYGGWMSRGVTKAGEVTHPDKTIMNAEAYNAYPLFLSSDFFMGVNWMDQCGFGSLIPDPTRAGKPYKVNDEVHSTDDRNGGINSVLNGTSTFIWCDGHVSKMAPVATNPEPSNRSKNLWDALRP